MKKLGVVGGIVCAVLAFVLVIFLTTMSYKNSAISHEEQINEDSANISAIVQKRVDMLSQLVNAVKDSKEFESETLEKITAARTQAESGDIENSNLTLAAVAEAYPEIKTVALYQDVMNATSSVENQLSGARGAYNADVKSYNKLLRQFPSGFFISITNYEPQDFKMFEENDSAKTFNPSDDNLWN